MPLFLQLNPADLPAVMAAKLQEKLLQLFYCTSKITEEPPYNEFDCERFEPYRRGVIVRLVPFNEPLISKLPVNSFAAQTIVSWTEFEEQPHLGDWPKLNFPPEATELSAANQVANEVKAAICSSQDKLSGWPYWSKWPGWVHCFACQERMEPLFQLVSREHIPYRIGNGARGYIWQCPNHPENLYFDWDDWSVAKPE